MEQYMDETDIFCFQSVTISQSCAIRVLFPMGN
jgi:hypothetical protein